MPKWYDRDYPAQGTIIGFTKESLDKALDESGDFPPDRSPVWSIPDTIQPGFYLLFYAGSLAGGIYFAITSEKFSEFCRNFASVAVCSAVTSMILVDGGKMLSDWYRAKLERRRQIEREKGRKEGREEVLQQLAKENMDLSTEIREKIQR